MAVHSPEFKEQLIRKSLPPHNQRMADLSHESGLHVNCNDPALSAHIMPLKPL